MDFLLLILRKLLHSNSPYVKVISKPNKSLLTTEFFLHLLFFQTIFFPQIILMSAAINCREFADYFGRMIKGKMNPAYVFEVEGAPYTIEEFYLDDICKLVPFRVRRQQMFVSILNGLSFLKLFS